MSAVISTIFQVVGPFAGLDYAIHDHQFEKGRYEFRGSVEQTTSLTNLFSYYSAYPEEQALAIEAKALRTADEPVLLAALGPVDPAPAPPLLDDSPKPTLAEAIGLLDPENDMHWTSNNLPGLDDLERLTGVNVTRADVNAIAEGFTRAKARAARQA